MKNNILTIAGFLSIILFSGCAATVNTVYESARMPDKGEVELAGNYSEYLPVWVDTIYFDEPVNRNYGGSVAFGLSENLSMKLRYERINIDNIQFWDIKIEEEGESLAVVDYFEIGGKLSLLKDHIAMSLPIGIYYNEGNTMTTLNPRLFFTLGGDKFELSLIPKGTIFFGEDDIAIIPGATLGLGFSSNLNKWAIRPEVGFDGLFINGGIGVSVNISPTNEQEKIYNPLYNNQNY